MNNEFKYVPYNGRDEELRGLIKNGNVYNLKSGMSGILLPEDSEADINETERDLQYLKEMYPSKVKLISAMVEEECDKLEYAGSPMLVEYPDKEYVRKIAREIYEKLNIKEDMEFPQEMQYSQEDIAAAYVGEQGSRTGAPGRPVPPPYVPENHGCVNCVVRNLIETMICNEFYCRRDRYRRRRRRFY